MSQTLHVDPRDPSVSRLLPNYRGREAKIRGDLVAGEPFAFSGNAWDGGTRYRYQVIDLTDPGRVQTLPGNGHFERDPSHVIPRGFAVIEWPCFCGKDRPPVIHVHQADLAPLLPAPVALTDAQVRVLVCTAGLKASYQGGKPRVEYSGLGAALWTATQAECKARGWLTKAGAITRDGRNVIEGRPERPEDFRRQPLTA